jgi:hypothetical protein
MEQEQEPNLSEDPHPKVWDLICVGTGLAEALLAGCVEKTSVVTSCLMDCHLFTRVPRPS